MISTRLADLHLSRPEQCPSVEEDDLPVVAGLIVPIFLVSWIFVWPADVTGRGRRDLLGPGRGRRQGAAPQGPGPRSTVRGPRAARGAGPAGDVETGHLAGRAGGDRGH